MTGSAYVHSPNGEVERQGGTLSVQRYTESPHEAGREPTLPTSCPVPCPGTAAPQLRGARSHLPTFARSLLRVLPGEPTAGPLPPQTLIFSSEDQGLLDLDRNQKGRPDGWGPERGEETPKSGSVETAGKSLTLRSLERRSSNPHDDRVELQSKYFQISVARKQMTC